jgi:hypothetical protein
MRTLATLMTIAVVTLGAPQGRAGSDEVPAFDVRASCRADTEAYSTGGSASSCLADEQRAREVLVSQWTQFAPENRANCMQDASDVAGAQSYVELLTCLQMAKDVKGLPKE